MPHECGDASSNVLAGDGNCFYRSFSAAMIEGMCNNSCSTLEGQWPDKMLEAFESQFTVLRSSTLWSELTHEERRLIFNSQSHLEGLLVGI